MASFKAQCTNCNVTLNLKDASFVGKTVRCPRCNNAFVVKRAPEAVAPEEQSSDPDDQFMDALSSDGS
jgi:phage FluMu protein Com